MAVKYTQIGELLGMMIRHIGRTRYEALLKDLKVSQAYVKNQSFRETIDRMERQLKTGRPKPPKDQPKAPAPRPPFRMPPKGRPGTGGALA
jgi:hypothetical protein